MEEIEPGPNTSRWRAVICYRSEKGPDGLIDDEHFFEELYELHALVERGPNFWKSKRSKSFTSSPDRRML